MTNPAGTRFAQAVAEFLAGHGHPYCERRAQRGSRDGGDLTGLIGWVGQCKAEKKLNIAGAMREAEVQQANADAEWSCAILKAPGKPISDAYVVMRLHQFARLTAEDTVTVSTADWDALMTLARRALGDQGVAA